MSTLQYFLIGSGIAVWGLGFFFLILLIIAAYESRFDFKWYIKLHNLICYPHVVYVWWKVFDREKMDGILERSYKHLYVPKYYVKTFRFIYNKRFKR